ncbi:glutathione-specific gamma-glutamylcyclotransferase 1-like [Corythoichthys intestinalis]|uniref:glutathione-specific gamma-glutamylcyclotransferase 1-like n=1 Tax=Corythoichthys intestinalis TaxID=161448 RepID=UPI0025A5A0BB|nr:glutathione-specific gamma-glutamylcyclotransferase 1-like [Corythoichthys intestinalis]XP_061798256.1 glutathione-specific gamma-glutamylcyclotransferase 1-like [Nerophis lumbriciformis]
MKPQDILQLKGSLWVFGYGSLVWKPDFVYQKSKIGYINGYKRRFWQGDDFYRGDKENLGRIVTLVEDQDASTWGVAFEIANSQIPEAMKYLNMREVVVGGYITEMVEFFPQERGEDTIHALVYIATSDNPTYLGPASDQEIADQIASCSGKTGSNLEYLLGLADFMRLHCPKVEDDHLFGIEKAVLNNLKNSETKLTMGSN